MVSIFQEIRKFPVLTEILPIIGIVVRIDSPYEAHHFVHCPAEDRDNRDTQPGEDRHM